VSRHCVRTSGLRLRLRLLCLAVAQVASQVSERRRVVLRKSGPWEEEHDNQREKPNQLPAGEWGSHDFRRLKRAFALSESIEKV
jgi:hypothetical protein